MQFDLLNLVNCPQQKIQATCHKLKQTFQDIHQACQKQLVRSQSQQQTKSQKVIQSFPQLKLKNKLLSQKASLQQEQAFQHFWHMFQQMDEIKNKDQNCKEKQQLKKVIRKQVWKKLSSQEKQVYFEYEKQLKIIQEAQMSEQYVIQDQKRIRRRSQRNVVLKKKQTIKKKNKKNNLYQILEKKSQSKNQKINDQQFEYKQNNKKNSNHTYQQEQKDARWDEDVDQYLDF